MGCRSCSTGSHGLVRGSASLKGAGAAKDGKARRLSARGAERHVQVTHPGVGHGEQEPTCIGNRLYAGHHLGIDSGVPAVVQHVPFPESGMAPGARGVECLPVSKAREQSCSKRAGLHQPQGSEVFQVIPRWSVCRRRFCSLSGKLTPNQIFGDVGREDDDEHGGRRQACTVNSAPIWIDDQSRRWTMDRRDARRPTICGKSEAQLDGAARLKLKSLVLIKAGHRYVESTKSTLFHFIRSVPQLNVVKEKVDGVASARQPEPRRHRKSRRITKPEVVKLRAASATAMARWNQLPALMYRYNAGVTRTVSGS